VPGHEWDINDEGAEDASRSLERQKQHQAEEAERQRKIQEEIDRADEDRS
jgi:hypothetical protein